MPIYWLNSKKCSIRKTSGRREARAFAAALLTSGCLFLALLGVAELSASAAPAAGPSAPVAAPALTDGQLAATLKSEILARKGDSFEALLRSWERRYGARAAVPLTRIASNSANYDPVRYVALMGAAKLGGTQAASLLVPFLKDGSWMIRSAALRALRVLDNKDTAHAVLPLLKDPALVVRSEAVDTVARLRPTGAVPALLQTIEEKDNYHGGKAQWVPQKALKALVELKAVEAAPKLRPLLSRTNDPELLEQTVRALEALTGRTFHRRVTLSEKVRTFKATLASP